MNENNQPQSQQQPSESAPKFKIGQMVKTPLMVNMEITSSWGCVKEYRYSLAFLTRKGHIDKRRNQRLFFESQLQSI